MPFSSNTFDSLLVNHIFNLNPKNILDVGAGAGKNGKLIRDFYKGTLDAIEPCKDSIKKYSLTTIYNNIFELGLKEYLDQYSYNRYDVVIFGDILEHLYKSEVIDYLDYLVYRSKWIIIIWPTNLIQDNTLDNQYEIHRSNFTIKDLSQFDITFYVKNFGWYNDGPEYPACDFHYIAIKGNLAKRNEFIYNFPNWTRPQC